MTVQQNPEATRIGAEWNQALEQLTAEDERLLTTLRLLGEVIDPRYEMKGIRLLVARSLKDPAFRARVLDDADSALAELRGHIELPRERPRPLRGEHRGLPHDRAPTTLRSDE